jgi:Na+-driven multidrug efflux pump
MKDLTLLTWLTQLGLSVAVPPVLFILLAVWLRDSLGWGAWVIWAGIILGLYCAAHGLVTSLKALKKFSEAKKDDPPKAFNEHT